MSEQEKQQTELIILEAARRVFILKGLDGARMQEIADEAGINKALLHYYFRSKDKLFDAVFAEAIATFMPRVQYLSTAEMPIKERIYQFIDTYVDMLHNNPYLPLFVLHELQRDPENIFFKMFQNTRVNPQMVFGNIQNEIEKGNIHQVDPKHLMVNIIGMCIIPFVGKPIMKHALFSGNETKYNEFLNERKTQIKSFVSLALNLQ